MLKKHATFARSDEGQRIIQLHLAGIPFSKSQVDMTPLQTEFFVEALNYMNGKSSSSQVPLGTQGEGDIHTLKRMVEARRRGVDGKYHGNNC